MFEVVCSSILPSSSAAIARAAAATALRPRSGAMPAWAATPSKIGRRRDSRSAPPGSARRSARRGRRRSRTPIAASTRRRPWRRAGPVSSEVVNSSSMPTGGGLTAKRRASSTINATAALLSAPRIASRELTKASSTSSTSTRVGQRHRVEVGAHHHRRRALGAIDARQQVAAIGAGLGGRVVLFDAQPELLELGAHLAGDEALRAGRRRDLAEAHERLGERCFSASVRALDRAARRRHGRKPSG